LDTIDLIDFSPVLSNSLLDFSCFYWYEIFDNPFFDL